MPKDDAQFTKSLGMDILSFSPEGKKFGFIYPDEKMSRSKTPDLKASIYQTEDVTRDLKDVKQKMIQYLNVAEESLLKNFVDEAT